MPFWLHQPKIILVINGMSRTKKMLIPLCLSLGLLGGWYAFYMFFFKVMLEQKQHKYNDLLGQQSLFNQTAASYDVAAQKHKQLSIEFDSFSKKYASSQKAIKKFLSLMKESGLLCHGLKPVKTASKGLYTKEYVSLSGHGDFSHFLVFLQRAQSLDNPVKIKSLVIKKDKRNAVVFKAIVRFLVTEARS